MPNNLTKTYLFLLLAACGSFAFGQTEEADYYYEENSACFRCHGQKNYYYYNDWVEREIKERMNPYYVIDSASYYESNHRAFQCIDCHSMDYSEFPHPGELRMEPKYECLDCHGGDDYYAQYHFEEIYDEFHASVHSTKHDEDFTCWMCHDPHTYKINARSDLSMKEIIRYDNEICLSCHANVDKYQLLTEKTNPNVIETHEWLPNQKAHFMSVRCIECHTEISDSILVAHKVLPKDQAVQRCVECHSSDSRLMASLYKFQARERRNEVGFVNAAILSESYVIGANRNYFLNVGSLVIFGLVILGIIGHATLRAITRKSN